MFMFLISKLVRHINKTSLKLYNHIINITKMSAKSVKQNDTNVSSKASTKSSLDVQQNLAKQKYEFAPIYHTRILSENIQLMPKMLNTYDLDKVIIDILKKKVEGKCISDGFIKLDSVEIVSRSLGHMENHVFNGSVSYFIKYKAEICAPVMGQIIECYVETNDETNSVCYVGDADTSPVEIYLFREHYLGNAEYAALKKGKKIIAKVLEPHIEFGAEKVLISAVYLGSA